MRVMVEKILAQYGTDMVVTGSAGSKTVRGFTAGAVKPSGAFSGR